MNAKAALSVVMASLLAWFPPLALPGNVPLGKALSQGDAELNGTRLQLETTVYSGDTLTTADAGLAVVFFSQGDQLHLGPASQVQVAQTDGNLVADLARGAVLARSGIGQTVSVRARGLTVNPEAPTRYEVVVQEKAVVVAARQAAVTVRDATQTFTVAAGNAMRFELAADQPPPAGTGVVWGFTGAQVIAIAAAAAGGGFLAGWLIADKRAENSCKDKVRALSPAVPESVCE